MLNVLILSKQIQRNQPINIREEEINKIDLVRVCLNFDFGDFVANIILHSVIFLLKLPAFDCEKCLLQNNSSSKNHANANSKHTLNDHVKL